MMCYCSGVSSFRHSASVWVTGYCLVSDLASMAARPGLFEDRLKVVNAVQSATAWRPASLHFDIGEFDDLGPFGRFIGHEFAELGRSHPEWLSAERCQL